LRPETRYRAEAWGDADNETLFARRRASRLRFSERDLTTSRFIAALSKALASAWQRAERLTEKDLSHLHLKELVRPDSRGASLPAIPKAVPRVLVVDDDQTLRELVRHTLEQGPDPIRVQEARDGLEAIRKAGLQKPDLLLLGTAMHGMT